MDDYETEEEMRYCVNSKDYRIPKTCHSYTVVLNGGNATLNMAAKSQEALNERVNR